MLKRIIILDLRLKNADLYVDVLQAFIFAGAFLFAQEDSVPPRYLNLQNRNVLRKKDSVRKKLPVSPKKKLNQL